MNPVGVLHRKTTSLSFLTAQGGGKRRLGSLDTAEHNENTMIPRQGRVPCPRSLIEPYPSLFPTMELRWGAVECFNPDAAVIRAEALLRKEGYVGAVAFRRSGYRRFQATPPCLESW
jgi:hypothetical protein